MVNVIPTIWGLMPPTKQNLGRFNSLKPWWHHLSKASTFVASLHNGWMGCIGKGMSVKHQAYYDKLAEIMAGKPQKAKRYFVEDAVNGVRHPRFDEFWASHHRMIYKLANILAKRFNQHPQDLIGSLVLRLNHCLHYFDEAKGSFGNLLYCRVSFWIWMNWLRFESEYLAVNFWKTRTTMEVSDDLHVANVEFAYHESDYKLYRIPDRDDDYTAAVIDAFESPADCWRFMVKRLNHREASILDMRFRLNMTLEAAGVSLGISKERVRQILNAAMEKIRARLKEVHDFNALFKEPA